MAPARFEVYSRGADDNGWTLHAEGLAHTESVGPEVADSVDLDGLKAGLEPKDVSEFYRSRTSMGVELGASFRTLRALWAAGGEAVGELSLPEAIDQGGIEVHPLLLDGCFQVMAEARSLASSEDGVAYLPFDMAWTASIGRSHFSHRAGLVFSDVESLRQQLCTLLDDGEGRELEHQAEVVEPRGGEDPVEILAAEYGEGRAVQFETLFQGEARRRISLPDYPFQRQRYWVDG